MQVTVGVEFGSRTVDVQGPGSQLMLTCILNVPSFTWGCNFLQVASTAFSAQAQTGLAPQENPR